MFKFWFAHMLVASSGVDLRRANCSAELVLMVLDRTGVKWFLHRCAQARADSLLTLPLLCSPSVRPANRRPVLIVSSGRQT